jgi:tRNA-dihydrouridine synthase
MNLLAELPKPFFVLAPMDDVTDTVFRQIIAECSAPDLFFTEFVNVDGLQSPGRAKLLKKLQFTPKETPIIAQIWGKNPENYYKTTLELKDMGFAGVDINMGCPVKNVVQNGACSALIDNRKLAGEIIEATLEAAREVDFPISVKTRLGTKDTDPSWFEFLLKYKLNMLTIHGRTVKEMSKVPAHWDEIGRVRELRDSLFPATLIVGNGDVNSRQQGEELAKQYNLDGIMIGRGIFHNPSIFSRVAPWKWGNMSKQEKIDLYCQHVELFAKTWPHADRKIKTLNKFCKIYIQGFDGAKELRDKLMHAASIEELLELLQ